LLQGEREMAAPEVATGTRRAMETTAKSSSVRLRGLRMFWTCLSWLDCHWTREGGGEASSLVSREAEGGQVSDRQETYRRERS
jgi:hypothetical protein